VEQYPLAFREGMTDFWHTTTPYKCSVNILLIMPVYHQKTFIVNKNISKNFEIHSEYKEFKAHMTIAYMKKGKADKYCKDILDKIEDMLPYRFNYSFTKNGKDVNEYY
jgi:hypothetical protein